MGRKRFPVGWWAPGWWSYAAYVTVQFYFCFVISHLSKLIETYLDIYAKHCGQLYKRNICAFVTRSLKMKHMLDTHKRRRPYGALDRPRREVVPRGVDELRVGQQRQHRAGAASIAMR